MELTDSGAEGREVEEKPEISVRDKMNDSVQKIIRTYLKDRRAHLKGLPLEK